MWLQSLVLLPVLSIVGLIFIFPAFFVYIAIAVLGEVFEIFNYQRLLSFNFFSKKDVIYKDIIFTLVIVSYFLFIFRNLYISYKKGGSTKMNLLSFFVLLMIPLGFITIISLLNELNVVFRKLVGLDKQSPKNLILAFVNKLITQFRRIDDPSIQATGLSPSFTGNWALIYPGAFSITFTTLIVAIWLAMLMPAILVWLVKTFAELLHSIKISYKFIINFIESAGNLNEGSHKSLMEFRYSLINVLKSTLIIPLSFFMLGIQMLSITLTERFLIDVLNLGSILWIKGFVSTLIAMFIVEFVFKIIYEYLKKYNIYLFGRLQIMSFWSKGAKIVASTSAKFVKKKATKFAKKTYTNYKKDKLKQRAATQEGNNTTATARYVENNRNTMELVDSRYKDQMQSTVAHNRISYNIIQYQISHNNGDENIKELLNKPTNVTKRIKTSNKILSKIRNSSKKGKVKTIKN